MAHYVPGIKAGEALRSLLNTIEALGDEFDFFAVTRDRDSSDTEPYPNIEVDTWHCVSRASVLHLYPSILSWTNINSIMQTVHHDVVYCLGFFDYNFTPKPLVLRRLSLVPKKPLVVAPQNEMSPGASRSRISRGESIWPQSRRQDSFGARFFKPQANLNVARFRQNSESGFRSK